MESTRIEGDECRKIRAKKNIGKGKFSRLLEMELQ
jgi:hypothetical protein